MQPCSGNIGGLRAPLRQHGEIVASMIACGLEQLRRNQTVFMAVLKPA